VKNYLAVGGLNRPFDDHAQGHVRFEAEADLSILNRVDQQQIELLASDIVATIR